MPAGAGDGKVVIADKAANSAERFRDRDDEGREPAAA